MTKDYGQYCGVAHALDLIGNRWTPMIVRELLLGPKRFTDLEQGLPGIPTNILSTRLREMEEAGLIERKLLPRPSSSVVYELTEYGLELEEPLLSLGRWGAKSMRGPKPDDFISPSALAIGLRAMFHLEEAKGADFSFEIPLGENQVRGSISDGRLVVPDAIQSPPDLKLLAQPATLSDLFRGHDTVEVALSYGRLQVEGAVEDARRFFDIFHLHFPR
jgi:DNA-binding HxlR family transcriptional regulator